MKFNFIFLNVLFALSLLFGHLAAFGMGNLAAVNEEALSNFTIGLGGTSKFKEIMMAANDNLIRAAFVGDRHNLERLLQAGANVNYVNEDGDTALFKAVWAGADVDIAEALLNKGATVTQKIINIANKETQPLLKKAYKEQPGGMTYECAGGGK